MGKGTAVGLFLFLSEENRPGARAQCVLAAFRSAWTCAICSPPRRLDLAPITTFARSVGRIATLLTIEPALLDHVQWCQARLVWRCIGSK